MKRGTGNGSVLTDAPVTTFSPFTFSSKNPVKNPLPIDLLYFDAELVEGAVKLNWTTLTESNNDYFTVERSSDGTDFEFLAHLQGAGNTTTLRDYSIMDANPLYGTSYYRLKQTDFDGQSETFDPVAITYDPQKGMSIAVYPNPSHGKFKVAVKGREGDIVLVVVLDMLGKEHYSEIVVLEDDGQTLAFEPSNELSPGIYMIQGSSNNKRYSKKLIIK